MLGDRTALWQRKVSVGERALMKARAHELHEFPRMDEAWRSHYRLHRTLAPGLNPMTATTTRRRRALRARGNTVFRHVRERPFKA